MFFKNNTVDGKEKFPAVQYVFYTAIIVLAFVALPGHSLYNGPAKKEWTIAYYMAGESSLEFEQDNNFREIIRGVSDFPDAYHVALFDRDDFFHRDTPLSSWKGTRVFKISGSIKEILQQVQYIPLPQTMAAERFDNLALPFIFSEENRREIISAYDRRKNSYQLKNTANKEKIRRILVDAKYLLPLKENQVTNLDATGADTLSQFLSYVKDNFPSRYVALYLIGHGSGWLEDNIMPSKSNDHSEEFYKSFKPTEIAAAMRWNKVDVLVMDSCMMADLETLWALKPCADYLVLNQIQTPAKGLDYILLLQRLRQKWWLTPQTLAKETVAAYRDAYGDSAYPVVSSVFRTGSSLTEFVNHWQSFCMDPKNRILLQKAAQKALPIPSGPAVKDTMVDLSQYLHSPEILPEFDSAAEMANVMISHYHQNSKANGLSIYLPINHAVLDRTVEQYQATRLSKDFPEGWVRIVPQLVP